MLVIIMYAVSIVLRCLSKSDGIFKDLHPVLLNIDAAPIKSWSIFMKHEVPFGLNIYPISIVSSQQCDSEMGPRPSINKAQYPAKRPRVLAFEMSELVVRASRVLACYEEVGVLSLRLEPLKQFEVVWITNN